MEEKGSAWEATQSGHSCHSTNNQATTRIQEFLGNETKTSPVMTSDRHIHSASESSQCRLRKCLSRDLTDRELIKKYHLKEVNQEQLAFYLKDIEQRFIALEQREIKLQSQLKERHEEFEMEKIVFERERVHEKMEWDRCMQEREAVLISTVMSVMIKRERVMEELRKQIKTEVRCVTLCKQLPVHCCHIHNVHTCISLSIMHSCLNHQSYSNTNYSGTRRKWWSFRKFGTNIPHRVVCFFFFSPQECNFSAVPLKSCCRSV